MKPTRLAIGIITVSTLLAAEPICTRILLPAIHRHYSKARVAEFTAYNKAHHIHPIAQTLREYDIACGKVGTEDTVSKGFLAQVEEPTVPPLQEVEVPKDVPVLPPPVEINNRVLMSSSLPSPMPVPEPSSLWLMAVGVLPFGRYFKRK